MQVQPTKVILIGATSGIGRNLAELFVRNGYKTGITGRRKELLEEIKNLFPGHIETECFDVTGTENLPRIKSLVNKLGGMDLLIYNAGIGEPSKTLDWKLDKLTVDTNVNGFIEICNWGFNYFISQGYGSLVTVSSIASLRGNSWAPAYSASKAFQSNYFEGLAIKAHRMKKPVSVICIEPGFVKTKMAKGNKVFWALPVHKAAHRIMKAIEKKKRKSHLSIRWWLIAHLLRLIPFRLYRRFM
jgi:short-subunit dehydrogenase